MVASLIRSTRKAAKVPRVFLALAVVIGLCLVKYTAYFRTVVNTGTSNHLSKSDKTNNQRHPSYNYILPPGFTFTPDLATRPPRKQLIMTLLTGPNVTSSDAIVMDDFCLGALFHAYTFLYNNLTKLHPADDTEFAVMITENQSKSCRESILALGARVIDVPIIPSPRGFQHKYDYTYTKYQMWAMEGIYEKILYLDGDLLYFTKSPLPIFKEIDAFHDEMENRLREERGDESGDSMAPYTSTKRYFYGGSQDWQMSCINGGLLLLEPNLKDYQGLIDLMPSTLGFGDQKTLDEYFKANTDRAGIHLSRVYNTQWVHHRTQQELVSAVGFHHKFFDDRIGDKPEGIKTFERFSRGFLDLRKIQLENFEAGRGGNLPIVPAVPNSFDGMVAVRKSRAKFDRFAILTIGGVNTTSEKSRKKFASHYSQAIDIGSTSFDTLAEKIGYVSNILLPKYEWVFVVNGRLILHRTHLPIHVALSRWIDNDTELIVFKDCPAELSGSFIVGRAARETLSTLYDDHRDKSMSDSDFWKLLLNSVTGNRIKTHFRQEELYSFEDSDCSTFFDIRK